MSAELQPSQAADDPSKTTKEDVEAALAPLLAPLSPAARYGAELKAGCPSDQPRSNWLLGLLLLRQRIADEWTKAPPSAPELMHVAASDQALRSQAARLFSGVPSSTFAEWRGSLPESSAWWWQLPDLGRSGWRKAKLLGTLVVVAVSASILIELLLRLVATGPDVLSTVLKGLIGLAAGGTILEAARRVTERAADRSRTRGGLLLAGILTIAAVATGRVSSWLAHDFIQRGIRAGQSKDVSESIAWYQRALQIDPDNAAAHFDLGAQYARLEDYTKAESEFRSAAQLSQLKHRFIALAALARVALASQKPPAAAYDLAQAGMRALDASRPLLSPYDQSFAEYSLRNSSARALILMNLPKAALEELSRSETLFADRAPPFCLEGLARTALKQNAREAWVNCIAYSSRTDDYDPIEPEWLVRAREGTR